MMILKFVRENIALKLVSSHVVVWLLRKVENLSCFVCVLNEHVGGLLMEFVLRVFF